MSTRWVRHIRINLAVHELRAGGDRPLLLLHGLGERTPSKPPNYVSRLARLGVGTRLHRSR